MQKEPNKRRTYFLALGLLAYAVVLVYEFSQIQNLESQVISLRHRLVDAQVRLEDLSKVSENHERQIGVIEETTSAKRLEAPSRRQLDDLKPGLYQLATDTQYDSGAEDATEYQITHVTLEMSFDSVGTKLHVGLASSGMIPQNIYFDYDNDGQVDVDMARDFAREIPIIGRRIARAYDPATAQRLYSIFIAESDNAEYTSVDDLVQEAGDTSDFLWSFVMSQYQDMQDWIGDKMEDTQSDK